MTGSRPRDLVKKTMVRIDEFYDRFIEASREGEKITTDLRALLNDLLSASGKLAVTTAEVEAWALRLAQLEQKFANLGTLVKGVPALLEMDSTDDEPGG